MKYSVIAAVLMVVLFLGGLLAAGQFGLIRLKSSARTGAACSSDDGHGHGHEQEAAGGDADHEEDAVVRLTAEQRKLINVEVGEAAAGTFENLLDLNGEFKLNLDRTARIMPRMPGFVTQVAVSEGDAVAKGQLLAVLTSHKLGEYYSDANSSAESEALALSEFQMAQRLKENSAISEKEYLRYKREYAEARIARRRAETMLQSLGLDPAHREHLHGHGRDNAICTEYEIRAPFDGVVIARDITVGESFAEDNTKAVFTVSNLNELWLDLQADASALRMLGKGMTASVSVAGSSLRYAGTVVFVASVIDEATRTGLVRVRLNRSGAEPRPGEFGSGRFRLPSAETNVLIPREAVQLISGERVVFVPQADGFVIRTVTVGKTERGISQIVSGLKPAEQYVSAGAFELKSILLTGGMDPHAGHGH